MKEYVEEIDSLIMQGEKELTWNSENLSEYIDKLHNLVDKLQFRVKKAQRNIRIIREMVSQWAKQLFMERKDGKKDALLNIEEKADCCAKKYSQITQDGVEITRLLEENQELFVMKEESNSKRWLAYVNYVDDIVAYGLLCAVGVSLGYIAEQMDPSNQNCPLFEARLELVDPDIVFVPPLDPEYNDSFLSRVESLIDDIIQMAALIPRLAKHLGQENYLVNCCSKITPFFKPRYIIV